MKRMILTLLPLAMFLGCSEEPEPTPSCEEQIDAYQDCIDEFCAGEGAGTVYCDCWRQRYGVLLEECECGVEMWVIRSRGLCSNIGPEAFSEQINCELGIDFARDWIDDCE